MCSFTLLTREDSKSDKLLKKVSARAEKQDDYRKDNNALRAVIFTTKFTKIYAKISIDIFPNTNPL